MPRGVYVRIPSIARAAANRDRRAKRGPGNGLAGRTGPNANAFQGCPSYSALHKWMNRRFPRTGLCEDCGESKRTTYASIDHTYTRDRADWRELCFRCHKRMDTKE